MAIPTSSSTRSARAQTPSTPRRPLSQASFDSDLSSTLTAPASVSRYPARSQTSNTTSPKKFKSALSVESRVRSTTTTIARAKTPTGSLDIPLPSTPIRKRLDSHSQSRSTTPLPPESPRTPKRSQSRCDVFMETSEMDVSRIDPETALVDAENVDAGELSIDNIDGNDLHLADFGKEDKVLVSVRVRPTTNTTAWSITPSEQTLKLLPAYSKSTGAPSPSFAYDVVLTGSANKPVYCATAKSHVSAAMEGYNAVIFAYGQTASGKTFTLTGSDEEPGIIPRAMKDVFAFIRRTPNREYLLRCSYLEIYNEQIFDLLAPSSLASSNTVSIQGTGDNVILTPLREEVVTSLKGVREVLERGYGNRRTASTDWNERSSRSHSVFRVVIESRERGGYSEKDNDGRATPGLGVPATPGGPRLQSRNGRSVQTSILSLIDLAGSEKATSDKDRTREGKYINTSLLTLGSVIGTLAENAAKKKNDHVPFRNSKLTRMLQPSLSGNARISVICTINPETNAVAETTSTLLFAQRVKRVQLNAKKKEIVDTEALLQRYKKEIEDLKRKLAEREAEAPVRNRRLSAREQKDESRAMSDLNSRIRQLTSLILTSQSVDESKGDESRPVSPSKLDFNLEPYQLQQELLSARRQLDSQSTQILSLEAALLARPVLPPDAPEPEKDKLIADQAKTIRELEIVIRGYEENLGEPLRAVREDVEHEYEGRLREEQRMREEKEAWAEELVKQLEIEKAARKKLEGERHALAAFVSRFDELGLGLSSANGSGSGGSIIPSRLRQPSLPSQLLGPTAFSARRRRSSYAGLGTISEVDSSPTKLDLSTSSMMTRRTPAESPTKEELARKAKEAPSLLLETTTFAVDEADLAEVEGLVDLSFGDVVTSENVDRAVATIAAGKGSPTKVARIVLQGKENIVPN